MATAVAMRDRVRDKLAEVTADFWADADIDTAVLDGIRALWPEIFLPTLKTGIFIVNGNDWVALGNDVDGVAITKVLSVELKDSVSNKWQPATRVIITSDGKVHFAFTNSTGSAITVRVLYKGKWTLELLYADLEDLVAEFASGRCIENRLGKRLRYDEIAADSDITAATAGDLIGSAGYFMYQFRQGVKRYIGQEGKSERQ